VENHALKIEKGDGDIETWEVWHSRKKKKKN